MTYPSVILVAVVISLTIVGIVRHLWTSKNIDQSHLLPKLTKMQIEKMRKKKQRTASRKKIPIFIKLKKMRSHLGLIFIQADSFFAFAKCEETLHLMIPLFSTSLFYNKYQETIFLTVTSYQNSHLLFFFFNGPELLFWKIPESTLVSYIPFP